MPKVAKPESSQNGERKRETRNWMKKGVGKQKLRYCEREREREREGEGEGEGERERGRERDLYLDTE